MSHLNAIEAIKDHVKFNINLEEGFAETLLEKLSPGSADVELTYLQVFLDKIFRVAQNERETGKRSEQLSFNISLLKKQATFLISLEASLTNRYHLCRILKQA